MLTLGAFLIILGFILSLSSNYSRPNITSSLVSYSTREWSVSASLEKNDKIVVELRAGSDWSVPPFDPSEIPDIGFLYADLTVWDPQRNTTKFWITFASDIERGDLRMWSINVTQNEGGLNTTSLYNEKYGAYEGIGGVVMYNGLYEVNVTGIWPSRQTPPSYLGIFKGILVIEYPYTYFLPVGVVIATSGAITSLIGARPQRQKTFKKRKSSHFSHRRSTRQR